MTDKIPLILASGSKYRKQQLETLGLTFLTYSPQIDETAHEMEMAADLTERLATEKAFKIKQQHPVSCVIGSDQVCVFNNQIFGKPGNKKQAIKQLQTFSNQIVQFYTALCVIGAEGQQFKYVDLTTVYFRQLTVEEIGRYIEKEQPLNCAGSFKVESLGLSLFKSVESSDPSALIGLPLIKLCEFLRYTGIELP